MSEIKTFRASWTPVADATSYVVRWTRDNSFIAEDTVFAPETSIERDIEVVRNGSSICVTIKSINTLGASNASALFCTITNIPVLPSAPTDIDIVEI
jgi:hypothetical protein